jgi:hypothetical protein
MLDAFLGYPFFLHRHRPAPRLKERESFLNHLQQLRYPPQSAEESLLNYYSRRFCCIPTALTFIYSNTGWV